MEKVPPPAEAVQKRESFLNLSLSQMQIGGKRQKASYEMFVSSGPASQGEVDGVCHLHFLPASF